MGLFVSDLFQLVLPGGSFRMVGVAKKNGLLSLVLRIVVDRKKAEHATGIYLDPAHWDPVAGWLSIGAPVELVGQLSGLLEKYRNVLLMEKLQGRALSARQAVDLLRNEHRGGRLVDLAAEMIRRRQGLLSRESLHTYKTQVTKLQRFDPLVRLDQVNERWIYDYQRWCIHSQGNKQTTAHKSLSFVKTVCLEGHRLGLIKVNPFAGIRIKKAAGIRVYLLPEELAVLDRMYWAGDLPAGEKNVLRCFLFACYTGLRYSDLKKLSWDQVCRGEISLKMQKTQRGVSVPITARARALLPDLQGLDPAELKGVPVFRLITNQVANRRLKSILRRSGIEKPVTFHSSRHSFATISLSLGIPLEVVRDLLGHTDVRITQVYARIMDQDKRRYMALWDQ